MECRRHRKGPQTPAQDSQRAQDEVSEVEGEARENAGHPLESTESALINPARCTGVALGASMARPEKQLSRPAKAGLLVFWRTGDPAPETVPLSEWCRRRGNRKNFVRFELLLAPVSYFYRLSEARSKHITAPLG